MIADNTQDTRKPRVGFVCLGATPLFDPSHQGGIGGAEIRAFTFARGLAQQQCQVHFVVEGPLKNDDATNHYGIQLHVHEKLRRPRIHRQPLSCAVENLRRLASRLYSPLNPASLVSKDPCIERLPVDTVCVFGVRNDTAAMVQAAKRSGKRVITLVASDRTLADIRRKGRRDRGTFGELGALCRYALLESDFVVAQTQFQCDSLRKYLGIQACLIRNPLPAVAEIRGYSDQQCTKSSAMASPYVLWIGRAEAVSKRADLLCQVAARCASIPFLAVMDRLPADRRIGGSVLPPNLTILPRVSPARMSLLFDNARLLLNTSDAEGFPNTFLQAGQAGVPVVSLRVDPDDILKQYRGGVCAAGNMKHLVSKVTSLWNDPQDARAYGRRLRTYVRCYHVDGIAQLRRLLLCSNTTMDVNK